MKIIHETLKNPERLLFKRSIVSPKNKTLRRIKDCPTMSSLLKDKLRDSGMCDFLKNKYINFPRQKYTTSIIKIERKIPIINSPLAI